MGNNGARLRARTISPMNGGKMAQYPSAMPDLRAVQNDPGVAYDPLQTNVVFAEDVNNIAAEILAIATELGSLPKGSFASVAARLTDMTSKTSTAQSTANSKAKKVTAVMRDVFSNGTSVDRTQATTVQNTAYPVLGFTGSAPYKAIFTLPAATTFNGLNIEFFCQVQTDNVQWIEAQFVIDGTPYGGWSRFNASGTVIALSRASIGTGLAAGAHEVYVQLRRTGAAATKIRTIDPKFRITETLDT